MELCVLCGELIPNISQTMRRYSGRIKKIGAIAVDVVKMQVNHPKSPISSGFSCFADVLGEVMKVPRCNKIVPNCNKIVPNCNRIWKNNLFLCGIIVKTNAMNGFIILISSAVILLEAAAIVGLYFYSRRIERRCNHCLVKTVREQDRMIQQLERILLEKETFEKLLKMIKNL